MSKIIDILKDWRISLYFASLILSIIFLIYAFSYKEVIVKYSPIDLIPNNTVIYSVDGCKVNSINDFYSCLKNAKNYILETNKGTIRIPEEYEKYLNEIKLYENSIVKFGVDIGGGYNIILAPVGNISESDLELAVRVIENRINAFGVKSINLYYTPEGYIIIQLPVGEEDIINRITQMGKFEAKINNITVFTGEDILSVVTSPPEAGFNFCTKSQNEWVCQYYFTLVISPKAAENFAKVTENLSVVYKGGGFYLDRPIEFYLDGQKVSELLISADLKGKPVTKVSIEIARSGATEREARANAMEEAKSLQVILANGNLPTKFEVVQVSVLSPIFGKYILNSLYITGIVMFSLILLTLIITYRRIKVFLLLVLAMVSEVVIGLALGIAVGQTLDLAALLGILVAVATGIDDQLIAVEEILRGRKELDIQKSIKKALFIILVAVLLEFMAVFPLFVAGLGLFRGFATMTILTIGVGYLITRRAFVRLVEKVI